jgi:hypothetical protein
LNANDIVEVAISNLANTMRMYVEAHIRFPGLFKVDQEEAIDNLDRSFEMKLEALHRLYDVSKRHFAYFDHGDTALLIAVRNALHHRNHPLFHSLNRLLHLEGGMERWQGSRLLLARHPSLHGEPVKMSHYIKIEDIRARLDPAHTSPYADKSITTEKATVRFQIIRDQLALPVIWGRGARDGFGDNDIYLDLMPIFVSAVCKVFKAMKYAQFSFKGFDAETYMRPFTTELDIDIQNPRFKKIRL